MAKKKQDKEDLPDEKRESHFIKIGLAELITAFTILSIGFGIGLWVASNNQKFETMQQQLDCNQKIEQAKEEWKREQKNTLTLESIKLLLINSNTDGKEVSNENSNK